MRNTPGRLTNEREEWGQRRKSFRRTSTTRLTRRTPSRSSSPSSQRRMRKEMPTFPPISAVESTSICRPKICAWTTSSSCFGGYLTNLSAKSRRRVSLLIISSGMKGQILERAPGHGGRRKCFETGTRLLLAPCTSISRPLRRISNDSHSIQRKSPPPEEIVERIENFLPFQDEAVDVFVTLAKYWPGEEGGQALQAFFERLLPYLVTPHPQDRSADHFAFIVRELFLYAVATALRYRRYEAVVFLTEQSYYLGDRSPSVTESAVPFTDFRKYVRSIEDHMDHDCYNKTADLIRDRANRQDLPHEDVMQADLVLYLRARVDQERGRATASFSPWYPDSLLYARRRPRPFELFARAAQGSSEGVERVFGFPDWSDFESLIQEIDEDSEFPTPGRFPLNVPQLVGVGQ